MAALHDGARALESVWPAGLGQTGREFSTAGKGPVEQRERFRWWLVSNRRGRYAGQPSSWDVADACADLASYELQINDLEFTGSLHMWSVLSPLPVCEGSGGPELGEICRETNYTGLASCDESLNTSAGTACGTHRNPP